MAWVSPLPARTGHPRTTDTARYAAGPDDAASPAGARQASDVVVPNVVTTTYLEIKALGICEAFHGVYGWLILLKSSLMVEFM